MNWLEFNKHICLVYEKKYQLRHTWLRWICCQSNLFNVAGYLFWLAQAQGLVDISKFWIIHWYLYMKKREISSRQYSGSQVDLYLPVFEIICVVSYPAWKWQIEHELQLLFPALQIEDLVLSTLATAHVEGASQQPCQANAWHHLLLLITLKWAKSSTLLTGMTFKFIVKQERTVSTSLTQGTLPSKNRWKTCSWRRRGCVAKCIRNRRSILFRFSTRASSFLSRAWA